MLAAAGTVQVLPCVLLSSGIDSVQLVWLCSLCVAMDLFYDLAGACMLSMLAVVAAVSGACRVRGGCEVCGGSE